MIPHRLRPPSTPTARGTAGHERGFVLVAALWLLLLCGAVAALLMLRGIGARDDAAEARARAQDRLDIDSAIATVAADILLRGPQSRWGHPPAGADIPIDGRRVTVAVTAETGRLDLNEAEPAVVLRALQGLGFSTSQSNIFVGQLAARRAQGPIGSWVEAAPLLARLPANDRLCADDLFTTYSGLQQPREDQAPPVLAEALGSARAETAGELHPGEALRLRISTGGGHRSIAIIRLVGQPGHVFDILRYGAAVC